ncbi:hypothetical protein Hdeb2414_s0009g00309641 [Helianthus debilis subsp. tardiflorus]
MRMMITGMMMLKIIDNDGDIDDSGGQTAARPPEPHRLRQWRVAVEVMFRVSLGCFSSKISLGMFLRCLIYVVDIGEIFTDAC